MAKVLFYTATAAQYNALQTKNENALYFLTDTGEFYKGATRFSFPIHAVTEFPESGETGILYVNETGESRIWNGSEFVSVGGSGSVNTVNTVSADEQGNITLTAEDIVTASEQTVQEEIDSLDTRIGKLEKPELNQWQQLKLALNAGTAPSDYPVGTLLPMEYNDGITSGTVNWIVAGYNQVESAGEATANTVCLHVEKTLFMQPYDTPELAYALTADSVIQDGKKYYTYDGSAYTEATGLTVGNDISANTYYEKNSNTAATYGSNDLAKSNLLQWLNSNNSVDGKFVFEPQSIFDQINSDSENGYTKRKPFKDSVPAEFLEVVSPAKIQTSKAFANGTLVEEEYMFFPLSQTQITGSLSGSLAEGEQLEFYKTESHRIKTDLSGTESIAWWTRTPFLYNEAMVMNVTANGSTMSSNPQEEYGVAPACIITGNRTDNFLKNVERHEVTTAEAGNGVFAESAVGDVGIQFRMNNGDRLFIPLTDIATPLEWQTI